MFVAPREWTFRDPAIAGAFDSHVREQLPWYDLATGIVAQIARSYVPEKGVVIDVGASTGNIGRALADLLKARDADLIACESSPDMAEKYEAPGRLEIMDARDFQFPPGSIDLIVCFLSMMFIPIRDRAELLGRMKRGIRAGGALVVFDKMVPAPGYVGTVSFRLTLAAKYEAGAKPEEIIAKELSIAGLQRPMDRAELVDFVEVFRFGDFAGFVWERPA